MVYTNLEMFVMIIIANIYVIASYSTFIEYEFTFFVDHSRAVINECVNTNFYL